MRSPLPVEGIGVCACGIACAYSGPRATLSQAAHRAPTLLQPKLPLLIARHEVVLRLLRVVLMLHGPAGPAELLKKLCCVRLCRGGCLAVTSGACS